MVGLGSGFFMAEDGYVESKDEGVAWRCLSAVQVSGVRSRVDMS